MMNCCPGCPIVIIKPVIMGFLWDNIFFLRVLKVLLVCSLLHKSTSITSELTNYRVLGFFPGIGNCLYRPLAPLIYGRPKYG